MINLTRLLVCVDVETTSLNSRDARIVEIAFRLYKGVFPGQPERERSSLVNPGVPIPESATKVHHITDAMVSGSPTFSEIAPGVARVFVNCDFAGMNVRFDLRVIAAEMARAGVSWSYVGAKIVDAGRLEQLGEPRTLSHLYEKHLGRRLEGAHGAAADVAATAEVIEAQLRRYPRLPRSLDLLHREQWPGEIDPDGRFKFVDGVACVMFGKWNGRPMRDVPNDYWDWLLSSDFPADVKALASQAKLGKFPREKCDGNHGGPRCADPECWNR